MLLNTNTPIALVDGRIFSSVDCSVIFYGKDYWFNRGFVFEIGEE